MQKNVFSWPGSIKLLSNDVFCLQLIRLQEENDSLVNKHSKNAQQMQNEDINLPNNLEVLVPEKWTASWENLSMGFRPSPT